MYALSYSDGGRKTEQLRMTFDGGAVTEVQIVPDKMPNPRAIPVTKAQLEGVVDPMSGAFLSAHSENPNGDLKVCNQTLPVFDGRQRFDLVLTPKRAVNVQRSATSGYTGPAVICRVKFIPIARLPARQSRHQAHDGNRRDRGLADPGQGHLYVRTLPDCAADPGGLRHCPRHLDRGRRCAPRQRRAIATTSPGRESA